MEVIIRPNTEVATELASQLIAEKISQKPFLCLGLATGRTMEKVYNKLVNLHKSGALDFSLVRTYNLDEYIGLSPDDPNSYRHYMNEHLFNKINIDLRNTHLPMGMADNLEDECHLYEESIKNNGGIDLQLLGIGRSGHIGFNEPLSALQSRTRDKALTPVTVAQNSPMFDPPESMPKRAITMGVGTILEADQIIMLVTGKEKAGILAKAIEGPISSMISATALQLHPKCTIIIDEDAAADLQCCDYYKWIFDNEPKWEPYR
ncbi:MAG: glucosamine-6-phosphate deaminase [Victivallales bacterium]|nr:glucosamine-6-phosphate deaminase [Victivallales bacterium]